jgi:circadian clock protein KaiC
LAATGIAGLDEILRGGLPRGHLYLVQGHPGVGKTTLGLQFLLEGAHRGENVLYVTLSETERELHEVAESHGWDLAGVTLHEIHDDPRMLPDDENTLFQPSDIDLRETMEALVARLDTVRPSRVVLDSLTELRLMAQSPLRYRRHIVALKQLLQDRGSTVLALEDLDPGRSLDLQLTTLAHGVIVLEQLSPLYGSERRRLRVLKLRGVRFRGGYHDLKIETGGLAVFARNEVEDRPVAFARDQLSSRIAELDRMLGGGIDRGTSTLIMGPAGSGKSSLVVKYAAEAAARGEPVAYYAFEESLDLMRTRARQLGIPFDEQLAAGRIRTRQVNPADLSPGEFTHWVRTAVERDGARVIVLDSLNGYLNAMPEERFLVAQLHELLMSLGRQGVTTLLIMAEHGIVGSMEIPIEVSYIADNVVLLRYFEAGGVVRKAISVVKRRGGPHEDTIRELQMRADGIHVGKPLSQFQGILAGAPTYRGELEELMDEKRAR